MVYGMRLAAFNMRHAFILESVGNECWIGGTITPEKLIIAATVCRAADGNAPLPEPETAVGLIEIHDFFTEADAWDKYVSACNSGPRTKSYERGGEVLKAPVELIVTTYLMRVLGVTEERAWSMPRGLALWYFEAAREQDGDSSAIVSEEEWAEMEAAMTAESLADDADRCRRMERLIRRKTARAGRCKTERGRRNVEEWFVEQLRAFDIRPRV